MGWHGGGHSTARVRVKRRNFKQKFALTEKRQTGIGDGNESRKRLGGTGVAKREWGAKHTCVSCGVKFYDLHRNPITCPKCGTEVEVEAARPNRRRPPAPPEPAPPANEEAAIKVAAGETDDDDGDEIIEEIDDDADLVEGIDDTKPAQPES